MPGFVWGLVYFLRPLLTVVSPVTRGILERLFIPSHTIFTVGDLIVELSSPRCGLLQYFRGYSVLPKHVGLF